VPPIGTARAETRATIRARFVRLNSIISTLFISSGSVRPLACRIAPEGVRTVKSKSFTNFWPRRKAAGKSE
jgi:hypothetical protein